MNKQLQKDLGKKLTSLKVDGGASQNNLLMQFQADILQTSVIRPKVIETTALGAACLAGLAIGFWKNTSDIKKAWKQDKVFQPRMPKEQVQTHLSEWQTAVRKCLSGRM